MEFPNEREVMRELTIDSHIPPSDPFLRQALFDVHKGVCFYSKESIAFEAMHVEHIHPRAKGGKDTIANYFPAGASINNLKGARYDSSATVELISINRLTYAISVLHRYIDLKKQAAQNIPKENKRAITMRKPRGMGYGGGELLLELLDTTFQEADYIRPISSVGASTEDRFDILVGKNLPDGENSLVDSIFASVRVDELFRKNIYITDEGIIYNQPNELRIYGGANIVSYSGNAGGQELRFGISFDYGIPEGSEGYEYMQNLRDRVNVLLASV